MKLHKFKWLFLVVLAITVSCRSVPFPVIHVTVESTPVSSPTIPAIPAANTTQIPSQTVQAGSNTQAAPANLPTPEETETPAPTGETPTHDLARTQYHLRARLDYWAHSVSVEETVRFVNHTNETLSELILLIDANRLWDVFRLESLTWESGDAITGYRLEKDQLTVPLPEPLSPSESASFKIVYSLILPELQAPSESTRPVSFGFSARQMNLVDWYPYLPHYKPGEGWVLNKAYYFGEHQVYDTADFLVELELVNPPANLVIAASAPAEIINDVYTYRHLNARNFALSASNMYQVYQQTVGDVEVYSYAFPFDAEGGKAALNDTASALALYSELFGPYPRASLSVVEADFLDGMEFDGLYFLSRGFYGLYDGSPRGYLTAIAVHETAHQWWYGLVANDQAHEPWLDEALCTYSERLFYENKFPELVDWWWSFRVNYYQPTGWIDGGIYDYMGFRPYRDAVYLRGALFLEEIRIVIGDDAFFEFLKSYAQRRSYQIASSQDFFSILSEFTDADLAPILQKYFQKPVPWN
jgi:hypothetical protein